MKKCLLLFAMITIFSTVMTAQCGNSTQYGYVGFYDDGSGDGNYSDYQSCSWQFTSATYAPIRLGFYNFETEYGYDYVRIYDGPDAGYPLVAELTGAIDPGIITCTSPVVYVTFTSDDSYTYAGFYGWWDVNTAMTACLSYPSSGNYNPYPDNVDQGVLIMPTNADQVTLTFTEMDLESCCDYVQVFDGTSTGGTLLGTFTGNSIPSSITSGGAMYLYFHTDGSIGYGGWSAYYQCSTCSATTNLSDCSAQFDDGSLSGNADVVYSDNANCSWLVNVPGAVNLTLNFLYMDLESCCDFVNVYDGPNAGYPLLASATGNSTPTGIVTSSGVAFVQFTSDASIAGQGWQMNYECSTVGVEESGILSMGEMSVYPNPTSDLLNVVIPNTFNDVVYITAFNSIGSVALTKRVNVNGNNRNARIELDGLAAGTYMIMATDGVLKAQQRVIVE